MSKKTYWLDSKDNVKKVYYGVWIVCALTILAEAWVHLHPYFEAESIYGFYGWYGFVGCVALVLGAKALRVVLMRSEDYYDG